MTNAHAKQILSIGTAQRTAADQGDFRFTYLFKAFLTNTGQADETGVPFEVQLFTLR